MKNRPSTIRPLNYLVNSHEVLWMFLNRSVQYIKAMGVNESVESYDNKKVIEFPFGSWASACHLVKMWWRIHFLLRSKDWFTEIWNMYTCCHLCFIRDTLCPNINFIFSKAYFSLKNHPIFKILSLGNHKWFDFCL